MLFHLHGEAKLTSFFYSIWLNLNLTATCFDYLLDNRQTKSNAIAVDCCSPLQLAKASEQFGEVLSGDSTPCVLHAHFDQRLHVTVSSLYSNWTHKSEFHGILDQVNDNLLEPFAISNQFRELLIVTCAVNELEFFEMNLWFQRFANQVKSFVGVEQRWAKTESAGVHLA